MAVGLIVSKIGRSQRSEGLGRNETRQNSNLRLYVLLNLNAYTKWPALAKVCALQILLVTN